MFDPYIICHDPPPSAFDFPPGYWLRDYPNTMDLCSAANGQRGRNLGCFCSGSHTDLHCDAHIADPLLAESTTRFWNGSRSYPETFVDYCYVACYCADTKSASIARASAQRNSPLNRILNNGLPSSFTNEPNDVMTTPGSPTPSDGATTKNAASFPKKQCGANCTSTADCAAGNGCTCKTLTEQYMPGKGAVMFAAACMISLGGKKRDNHEQQLLRRPCPCNGTYVSHACCGAVDGMVHEPTRFKLGEVLHADG